MFGISTNISRKCTVLQLLGTPTESDLRFIRNEDAKRYLAQLPQHPRQSLSKIFPHVHPLAIDLVDKMLTLDPTKRITGNTIDYTSTFYYIKYTQN